jgi:hypothetical protein
MMTIPPGVTITGTDVKYRLGCVLYKAYRVKSTVPCESLWLKNVRVSWYRNWRTCFLEEDV